MCASILVSNFLPQVTTQSLYFGWSLTGGSTVIDNLDSGKKLLVWNYVWKSLEFWTQKSVELLFMYRELTVIRASLGKQLPTPSEIAFSWTSSPLRISVALRGGGRG